MKTQPAQVNYFFGDVYKECGAVIKNVFEKWLDRMGDYWEKFVDNAGELKDGVLDIITFEAPISGFFRSLFRAVLFGWSLAILLLNVVFTPAICAVFSLLYIIVMTLTMFFIYLFFTFVNFLDWLYRKIKKISSGCPACQHKFDLPVYVCPSCGVEHSRLIPSKYGILKRECECGEKLPTTFLNGRQKLDGLCPHCGAPLSDAGAHVEVWVPVIGGPSSGKTCLITMAISQIEKNVAPQYNLEFTYKPNVSDNREDLYETNMSAIEQGYTPPKTDASASNMQMKYYQFNLNPPKGNVGNFISLCDMPGEIFTSDTDLAQIGLTQADGFIVVLDPLSIQDYRDELAQDPSFDPYSYGASDMPMDEVTTMLLGTLDNMLHKNGARVKKVCAVVFTKLDIPGLEDKIGPAAVTNYMNSNKGADAVKATNAVCEKFLLDYGETNFVHVLKQKFTDVRFFTCAPLGHNQNGKQFTPVRVEDSVLWLIGKNCPSLKFKV